MPTLAELEYSHFTKGIPKWSDLTADQKARALKLSQPHRVKVPTASQAEMDYIYYIEGGDQWANWLSVKDPPPPPPAPPLITGDYWYVTYILAGVSVLILFN